jgi:hypothetical protein
MKFRKTIVLAIILASANLAAAGPRIPLLPFEKYTLPNGLQVILHEDHSTPLVTVNVWYHVGAKNEQPGRTGFAHLFEHIMFQGSKHQKDYFGPLQQAGGRLNGSTSQDRTNYWETVHSNYLATALWMESDRMGVLLPAMTQANLDNHRDVVKNERRQSYDTVWAAAIPPPIHTVEPETSIVNSDCIRGRPEFCVPIVPEWPPSFTLSTVCARIHCLVKQFN